MKIQELFRGSEERALPSNHAGQIHHQKRNQSMKTTKRFLSAAGVSLALAFTSTTFAQEPPEGIDEQQWEQFQQFQQMQQQQSQPQQAYQQQPLQQEKPKKERRPSSTKLLLGWNQSDITSCYKSDCNTSDSWWGLRLGFIRDIPLVSVLSLQTGGMITGKGFHPIDNTNDISEYFYLGYLQAPIMASVRFSITESVAVRIGLGNYVAFGLYGLKEIECDDKCSGMDAGEVKFESYNFDGLSRLDFGITFDLGVEFGRFYAGIVWDEGLLNISDSDVDDLSVTNSTFGITVGIIF
jgi:hypothetical protein